MVLRVVRARAGCPGTNNQTPVLVQNGNTTGGLGGNIRLTIANAPPTSIAVFALGFQQLSVPIFGSCTLLTSPDILLGGLTNANGRAAIDIAIPPGAAGSFFAQGGVLDAAAAGGISMTNGVSPAAL